MKILIKKDEKEKMYIQIHDLVTIYNNGLKLPKSNNRFLSIINDIESYDSNDFIILEEQSEINLLKAFDFIKSYQDVTKYSEEELEEKIQLLKTRILIINNKYKKNEKLKKDPFLTLRYSLLYTSLKSKQELLKEKIINSNTTLPQEIIDYLEEKDYVKTKK